MPRPRPFEDRFWEKVSIPPDVLAGCWIWVGAQGTKGGYGKVRTDGGKKSRQVLAHRASWEFLNGSVPDGLNLCHVCDNPRCVNPGHMFLGTLRDNNNDRHRKGRSATGERNGNSILTANDVVAIRAELAATRPRKAGVLRAAIAAKYGVSRFAVNEIAIRKRWKHVAR